MKKFRIVVIANDSSACAYYRSILPTVKCEPYVGDDIEIVVCDTPHSLPESPRDYDCFIFSRVYANRTIIAYTIRLKLEGKVIVWDLDDDFMEIPEWSPVKPAFPMSMINELDICLKMSDVITVSTENLMESILSNMPWLERSKFGVLENLIDPRWFDRMRSPTPPGGRPGPLRIIWTGSSSHEPKDFGALKHIYDKYKDDKRFQFITYGHRPNFMMQEEPGRTFHVVWGSKKDYEPTLAALSPDISILCIEDNRFNRCKSGIKYFESTMAGAVCIATPIPPYSDVIASRVNGLLADGPEGWEAAIEYLASDNKWLLSTLHANAVRNVESNYSWHLQNPRMQAWIDHFRRLSTITRP